MEKFNRIIKSYKTDYPDDMLYWGIKQLKKNLSYGCDYTIATSPRAGGKSSAAIQLFDETLRDGYNVAWCRYNKSQLGMSFTAFKKWYPDIKKEAIPHNNNAFLGVIPGYEQKIVFCPWNLSDNAKGIDVPNIKYQVMDEFIPEFYTTKTRKETEYTSAMSVRTSLNRSGIMRSICLANCIYWLNPFSLAWNFPPVDVGTIMTIRQPANITLDNGEIKRITQSYCWENVKFTPAMIDRVIHNDGGSMTIEELESYYNNATKQEYSKIEKCPKMNINTVNYQLMNDRYYFSYRNYNGCFYFCKIRPNFSIPTYVDKPEYVDLGIKHYRYPNLTKTYETYYNTGRCIFDSNETLMHFQAWLWNLRKRV